MLTIIRRWLHRPAADTGPEIDPNVSRAGQAVAGLRPGSTRHRPTAAERDLAGRLGTSAYDSERGQI